MDAVFWICVGIMNVMSDLTGISYQAINVWLFVIIHPLITLWFAVNYIRYKIKAKRI